MKLRRDMRLLALVSLLPIMGCVGYETSTFEANRVGNSDAWTYTWTYLNLESDESTGSAQDSDFDDLIEMWKGETFVKDEAAHGRQVVDRKLWVSKGRLFGEYRGRVEVTDSLFDHDSWSREPKGWRLTLEDEEEVASTNGVLKKSDDGSAIEWPQDARVLRLATRTPEFTAASRFAERFEDYLKTSAKASVQEGTH